MVPDFTSTRMPSLRFGGTGTTTSSPGRSPAATSSRSPSAPPVLTARRSTSVPVDDEDEGADRAPCGPRPSARARLPVPPGAPAPVVRGSRSSRRNVTLTPMSGRIRGSSALKRDPHEHRGLLAIGRRHHRDDARRNLPVGIRVEHGGHVLAARDAVDVRLVDVDVDLERPHVDDRADAGARESAAGRHRRHHLARLRVLRNRHAAERRADDRVVELASAARRSAARRRCTCWRAALNARLDTNRPSACASSTSACDATRSLSSCVRRPSVVRASPSRTSFSATARRAASACASASTEGRPRVRVVQPRKHLALRHGHAFLDVHLDDLAGDLRRDGRAPPRGDVARGVQHGRLRAGRALGDGRDLHLHRTLAREPHARGCAAAGDQQENDEPRDPSAAARPLRLPLDAQRCQVLFEIVHAAQYSEEGNLGSRHALSIRYLRINRSERPDEVVGEFRHLVAHAGAHPVGARHAEAVHPPRGGLQRRARFQTRAAG